ncbi:Mrp/NBP35 family ATP-binding protein [Elizabethkingia occulta]|jgi:ATP-binding protein involved in chromosome partitioning|uniref:Iron-sulfur cluster carrier protein n=2 Tax=Elizabethkingia TaxID=308865 RepID=A0AAJ3NC29_9FLAO|nr:MULTISPECIES: Mrp/NBP35 family ATP-binding protein [Elizabethkingia]MDR2229533.1 Mrp/NBP35 family ATP-binding protein [Flavobacteriaceae bacterium]AQX09456.1 chromosome partitioning protein [Elizabethkingia ursingii]KUY30165.1 chromosome partitioning protein [Elizabethkingia ursingii]MCL1663041.1 Mrp/NBP35 family ATP-binding protein [Elizabethkingia ursingii]MCL1669538.1 Mrp/NBP35 family ATP-binding protein [Elizabethkingia ursingii]
MIKKEAVQDFLKEVEVDDLVKNIQIMGDSVFIDMVAHSPAMHEKKKLEVAMKQAFTSHFGENIVLKLKIESPEASEVQQNQIKGKQIPGIKNIIAIASGKGGVGKSTVAANMAVTLAKMGFSVGLLDADIYGPSVPTMFDTVGAKPVSVEENGRNLMKPIESYGVKLLSIGYFSGANQAVVWRGPMASKALNQMLRDAAWGELDFLLLDLPPGTGDIHLSIIQEVPVTGAVIVSTPQHVALADVRKGIGMFQMDSINIPVLGLIENMAYFTPEELPENKYYIFGKEGAKNLAEDLGIPVLGEIPLIQSIREAGDVGRPVALQENTGIADIYTKTAQNMIESLVERNENLPPTEAVKITTMAGCSPKK